MTPHLCAVWKLATAFVFLIPFSHTNNFLGWNMWMNSLIVLSLDGKELLIADSFKRNKIISKGSDVMQPIYKSLSIAKFKPREFYWNNIHFLIPYLFCCLVCLFECLCCLKVLPIRTWSNKNESSRNFPPLEKWLPASTLLFPREVGATPSAKVVELPIASKPPHYVFPRSTCRLDLGPRSRL